ncbi:MAG TPA: thioredoxin family protein [Phycisphaerae bacterium]|nr:thioredoxin family protein [Phycisphaerae bacterium]
MTVSYDSARITAEGLARAITEQGPRFSVFEVSVPDVSTTVPRRVRAPVPDDAPEFLALAFEEAGRAGRPIVLAFEAAWCGACQRLKEEVLQHPDVAKVLTETQFVTVDLDKWPMLGDWYGVTVVPHVVLVDRDGFIVDRVGEVEGPAAFLGRLERVVRV